MKLGIENRRQAITAGILAPCALFAIIFLGRQFISTGSTAPPPPPPVVKTTAAAAPSHAPARKTVINSGVSASGSPLDPTLHPEVMAAAEHLDYTGNGRNIFSPNSAPPPVKIQTPLASARLAQAAVPTGPAPPPPPPPIPFKLFGVETKNGVPSKVFLLHGEDVFMAQVGDIVMRQYKVTRIMPNAVEMEDLPNNNKQVLPLVN